MGAKLCLFAGLQGAKSGIFNKKRFQQHFLFGNFASLQKQMAFEEPRPLRRAIRINDCQPFIKID
jgi:hypothetical protein